MAKYKRTTLRINLDNEAEIINQVDHIFQNQDMYCNHNNLDALDLSSKNAIMITALKIGLNKIYYNKDNWQIDHSSLATAISKSVNQVINNELREMHNDLINIFLVSQQAQLVGNDTNNLLRDYFSNRTFNQNYPIDQLLKAKNHNIQSLIDLYSDKIKNNK